MKKILLFISATTFFISCTSSDNSPVNNPQNQIKTPEWLHGEWIRFDSENQATILGYKITYNDVCDIYNFETDDKHCVYEFIKELNQSNYISKVIQESTDSSYYLEIREESQFTYDFKKVDNTTISVKKGSKTNPYIKYRRKN